jgi:tol-pal system protein YbgF
VSIMRFYVLVPTARVLATLAVAVTLGGCAMKGDIRVLQEELRAMAARQDSLVTQLRMEALQTQDTLRTQGDQFFDFRGDISRQLQQISQSLVRLEALAGENQRGLTAVRSQLSSMGAGGGAPRPTTTGPTTPGGGERLVGGGGGDADELYAVAREQQNRGSLNSAARAFEQFVAEHPADPRVPDAHFFLADILSQQDRPEEALAKFQEVQQLFPTAPRVPQALYRIAELQQELGRIDQARATLERIVNTYPDDLVAQLAREKLREIG